MSATIPFLLLPVLTRYLSPEQYGQVAMFNMFTAGLASIIGLSVHGAANRRFFDKDVTNTQLARFNGNCLFILLSSTVFALFVFSFFYSQIANYLGFPPVWIYFGILNVCCSFLLTLRLGQWQIRGKAKLYGVLQVTNSLVVISFSILFVVVLHLGAEGRIYGMILTGVIIGFISYCTLIKDKLFLFEYNRKDINEALSFGIPLIPHVLGGFLLLSVDRLLINKELGLEMTGVYMVAFSLGSALNIIFNSINKAYSPWLFARLKENDFNKKIDIVKKTYLYFAFLLVMSLLAFFIAPPLLKVMVGEKFYQAAEVLPILLIGQVFFGMYFMVTNYIFYVKKTKYLSYVTIFSGLINVLLLFLLIPSYGISGAALAFLIANVLRFIGTWALSARLYSMPWALWRS
ncbi:polysaccharide biosynthesis protein [Psychromonas marina]|uniref:Polysaccharide biosynthesis protein n=1 Tax=Psychromonas marina TaxID=88364 RepID=A0ABQ6DV84_9GAMM|nr:polysaccharide biosynthesis protein [Psychromonas marina]